MCVCSLGLAADKVREARNAVSHRCDEFVMATNFPINGREEEEAKSTKSHFDWGNKKKKEKKRKEEDENQNGNENGEVRHL